MVVFPTASVHVSENHKVKIGVALFMITPDNPLTEFLLAISIPLGSTTFTSLRSKREVLPLDDLSLEVL